MNSPNILFFLPDQHRHDWLGVNENLPLRMPTLDQIIKKGTRFRRCYTPSPVCSPARACLATGRSYTRCGVRDNIDNTPLDMDNYYRILKKSGYQVSGVGKFDLHKVDLDWGLDGKNMLSEYGFTSGCDNEGKGDAFRSWKKNKCPRGPYMEHLRKEGMVEKHIEMYEQNKEYGLCYSAISPLPEKDYCDNWIGENAIREIEKFKKDQPWHLVVNFTGPHDPYDVLPSMKEAWEGVEFPKPFLPKDDNPEEVQIRRRYYAAMLENIDRQMSRILKAVESRGELENTLIVYSSDHGEMLGDYGHWGKCRPEEGSSHIPMILKGPGVPEGKEEDALVSLHDLCATFIELAGKKVPIEMDSKSLWPVLASKENREHLVIGLNQWRMVIRGDHKVIFYKEGYTEIYNLKLDPNELQRILPNLENKTLVDECRRIVENEIPF